MGHYSWKNDSKRLVNMYNNLFNLTASLYSGYVGTEKGAIRVIYNASVDSNLIYNNTFYISDSSYLYGIGWQAVSEQTGNEIKNNIIQMTANSSSVF